MRSGTWLMLVVALCSPAGWASIGEVVSFETPRQEADYQQLVQELRCVVCQNQNLAESNAALARDMRVQIQQLLVQGSDRQAVVDHMVARYGDFVRYQPPFKPSTWLLWLAPALLLLAAGALMWRLVMRGGAA